MIGEVSFAPRLTAAVALSRIRSPVKDLSRSIKHYHRVALGVIVKSRSFSYSRCESAKCQISERKLFTSEATIVRCKDTRNTEVYKYGQKFATVTNSVVTVSHSQFIQRSTQQTAVD